MGQDIILCLARNHSIIIGMEGGNDRISFCGWLEITISLSICEGMIALGHYIIFSLARINNIIHSSIDYK